MAIAYYTCNLLPAGLITRCGYAARWLGNYPHNSDAQARRDALGVHPMTCPYVTRLVAAADELLAGAPKSDCVLVPGGCDAMRRMGDLLETTYPGQVFVLSMPRSSGKEAVSAFAADLAKMEAWLRERLPEGASSPTWDASSPTWDASPPAPGPSPGDSAAPEPDLSLSPPRVDYPSPPRPGGVFVVAGPLSDASLLELVERLGGGLAGLDSCTSPDRWKPLAAEGPATEVASADYEELAARVLALGMCPRRSTIDRRDHLARRLDESRPSSVIYARQSFCDPGAYDALTVAALANERGIPYLEIEVGFPFEPSGPLLTRVEAFLEAQSLDDDLLDGGDLLADDDLPDGGDLLAGEDLVEEET